MWDVNGLNTLTKMTGRVNLKVCFNNMLLTETHLKDAMTEANGKQRQGKRHITETSIRSDNVPDKSDLRARSVSGDGTDIHNRWAQLTHRDT